MLGEAAHREAAQTAASTPGSKTHTLTRGTGTR